MIRKLFKLLFCLETEGEKKIMALIKDQVIGKIDALKELVVAVDSKVEDLYDVLETNANDIPAPVAEELETHLAALEEAVDAVATRDRTAPPEGEE